MSLGTSLFLIAILALLVWQIGKHNAWKKFFLWTGGIVALLNDEMDPPPPGTWWLLGVEAGRDTIKKLISNDT